MVQQIGGAAQALLRRDFDVPPSLDLGGAGPSALCESPQNCHPDRSKIIRLRMILRSGGACFLHSGRLPVLLWPRAWSSFRHYLSGEAGTVEIGSQWTARRREQAGIFLTRGHAPSHRKPSKLCLGGGVPPVASPSRVFEGWVMAALPPNRQFLRSNSNRQNPFPSTYVIIRTILHQQNVPRGTFRQFAQGSTWNIASICRRSFDALGR